MIARTRGLLCAIALSVAACAPQGEPSQEEIAAAIAAVRAVRDMEVAAVNTGNVDVSYLAADAVMMLPNEPALSGSAAIGEWISAFLSQFTASLSYTSSEVTISGDWAIERYTGTLTITPIGGGDPIEEPLKGIHVYRRGDDGSWKLLYDVWNSDTPAPEM